MGQARHFECAACRRLKRTESVRQVGPMEPKEFNKVMGVDTLELHLPADLPEDETKNTSKLYGGRVVCLTVVC